MKVYGHNLSPFVRRVKIWLSLQGVSFSEDAVRVGGPDYERLLTISPSGRVPVLELDDGTRLTDSMAICDYLETEASAEKRLLPGANPARRDALQVFGQANSVAEKAVALMYEAKRRPEEHRWPEWLERLKGQVIGGMGDLEAHCPEDGFFGGELPNGVDAVVVCAYDFVDFALADVIRADAPNVSALAERANARPEIGRHHPKLA
ncbi:MAG: glutathione S-transferase family protein [Pseudomonadota bacterium]